jgi:uroporphyrinogen decarboxylase
MSKELLFRSLRNEKVERVPWVPFAGVHAGKLKGYSADEVLQDKAKLLEALLEVNKYYQPDGQPVIFDLQVEAEILGCDLKWDKVSPPTVSSHPLAKEKMIPCDCKIPKKADGRLPIILDVMRSMKQEVGEHTALYGLITGPFTLASHLRGTDIFMDMYDDEDYVKSLLEFSVKVGKALTDYYVEAGMDVISFVDPLVSQISPNHFEAFLSGPYSELFDYCREKEVFSSFFVCGDATKNIEVMCRTRPNCISVDENVDIAKAKVVTDKYDVVIAGNIQLTITMLHGSQQDNMKAVIDIIDSCGTQNLIISPGCDMPYDCPVENVIACAQAVNDYENTKKALENYVGQDFSDIEINIPDYHNLSRPLVEVFTLDSATCAACSYMMNVSNEVKAENQELFDLKEYKFTIKENIARCMKQGVKHLPSLYINGELKWSSIIPSKKELLDEIKKY